MTHVEEKKIDFVSWNLYKKNKMEIMTIKWDPQQLLTKQIYLNTHTQRKKNIKV